MNWFWKLHLAMGFLAFTNLILWCIRSARDERLYDGVPKYILHRVKEINAGLLPADMAVTLKQWMPEGEDVKLRAEASPIFQERGTAPTWCIRVSAQGDGIDSGFDALFNRRGEILT